MGVLVFTLTGFADEVSFDLAEQLGLMTALGIRHVEFRSAWRTKVLDLSEAQLQEAKGMLDAAGIALSSVGSDIGKIQIADPFEAHLERAGHAVEVAQFFGSPYIRMFSFFIPEADDPDSHRDEVMRRTRAFVDLAEAGGVTMLHENEKDIFGDIPRRVVDLVTTMESPNYRAIFDPANYVQCGIRPVDEALPVVRPYTDYIHIKDAKVRRQLRGSRWPGGRPGPGTAPRVACRRLRRVRLASSPHLGEFDAFGGLCGPRAVDDGVRGPDGDPAARRASTTMAPSEGRGEAAAIVGCGDVSVVHAEAIDAIEDHRAGRRLSTPTRTAGMPPPSTSAPRASTTWAGCSTKRVPTWSTSPRRTTSTRR